ncbi:hypothetical protein L323_10435 [Ruminiclostridium papyrosolvens C7]|uniref:Uncharacterized protein n=1 Tax=Ruminiclostridium papyrosolvens C7 TaxID=1330534 RepID=U4R129_9FIRM|nr:hypothetical protein L323_10435 [Ruminiclostridium papyrosolvens C7]
MVGVKKLIAAMLGGISYFPPKKTKKDAVYIFISKRRPFLL